MWGSKVHDPTARNLTTCDGGNQRERSSDFDLLLPAIVEPRGPTDHHLPNRQQLLFWLTFTVNNCPINLMLPLITIVGECYGSCCLLLVLPWFFREVVGGVKRSTSVKSPKSIWNIQTGTDTSLFLSVSCHARLLTVTQPWRLKELSFSKAATPPSLIYRWKRRRWRRKAIVVMRVEIDALLINAIHTQPAITKLKLWHERSSLSLCWAQDFEDRNMVWSIVVPILHVL